VQDERTDRWTFLTNHARVLICAARWPSARIRDIASMVEITERQTQSLIRDLEDGGYLERVRVGRRNHYKVFRSAPFRHAFEGSATVGDLVDTFHAPAAERMPARLAT